MTGFQRVVKYIAIALAIALLIGIISVVSEFFAMLDSSKNSDNDDLKEITLVEESFKSIDIDIEACSLEIKDSDDFKVLTDSDKVTCKIINDTLTIKEKDKSLFNHHEKNIVLYLPNNYAIEKVSIDGGAGKISINSLICENLDFNIGAGSVILSDITVSDLADIDGGVGSFKINNAKINNLNIDLGVGNADISAHITNAEIIAGIGDLVLNLEGDKSEYTIKSDAGIGDIIVEGTRVDGSATTGDGDNVIKISGGISSINVNFISE